MLRSANFNTGLAEGFVPDSGTWTATSGRYQVAPESLGGDAVSVFYVDQYIPTYFEMLATIRAVKPTGGYKANAYLIFDYQSPVDFKYAGVNVSTSKLEMGYRDASGWNTVVQAPYTTALKAETDYNVLLALNGNTATLVVNNRVSLTYTFAPRTDADGFTYFLQEGMVGIGANNAKGQIDNVAVQRIPPEVTFDCTVDFSDGPTELFEQPATGTWDSMEGRYYGTAPSGGTAIDLLALDVAPASYVQLSVTLSTAAQGGLVFDHYGPDDFKFVVLSVETGQILLGHRTLKAGWVVDAALTSTSLSAATDYTLEVTLKGTTVSVALDDQAAFSCAYNAVVTDGAFGMLVRDGQASFDQLNVKTDDPQFAQPALPFVSVSDVSLTEGNSGSAIAVVSFALSQAAEEPVTVDYATADETATAGSDYEATAGTVTFARGQTSVQVALTILGDIAVEPDETFRVQLSNPVGAQVGDGTGTVTILNDDALPRVTVAVTDASASETGMDSGTLVVSRDLSNGDLAVRLAWSGSATIGDDFVVSVSGGDWNATDGTLTLHDGEGSATLTLTPIDDTSAEGAEGAVLTILAMPSYQVGASGAATVTIADNDSAGRPALSVADVSVTEGRTGRTTKATVTITLSGPSTVPVTVELTTVDGTATGGIDYRAVVGATITFDPGVTSKSYTLSIYGDNLREGDEQFTVQLLDPTNAVIADGTGVVKIVDDDTARLLAAASGDSTEVLSCDLLAPVVDEAITRWEAILGTESALLRGVQFTIADLSGLTLGETPCPRTILLDVNGAGNGWFIDPTPGTDEEFTLRQRSGWLAVSGDAAGRMDLLSVVMHEFGHVLGLDDLTSAAGTGDLMCETLAAGTRRTATQFMVFETSPHRLGSWRVPGITFGGNWCSEWLKELGFFV